MLQIMILQPIATGAMNTNHPYLIVCPLGHKARGGPQFVALLFFLPCAFENLSTLNVGLDIMGLVVAGSLKMGFPFPHVNGFDQKHCLKNLLSMPAFSEINCEADGVLSGMADMTACLMRYSTADLSVVLVGGTYQIKICGFDVTDSQFLQDYRSPALTDGFFRDAVVSQLVFGHANGASEADREVWQSSEIARVTDQITDVQGVANGLAVGRVKPGTDEVDLPVDVRFDYALFTGGEWVVWDPRHPLFRARGKILLEKYQTEILCVSPREMTSEILGYEWRALRGLEEGKAGVWREQKDLTLEAIAARNGLLDAERRFLATAPTVLVDHARPIPVRPPSKRAGRRPLPPGALSRPYKRRSKEERKVEETQRKAAAAEEARKLAPIREAYAREQAAAALTHALDTHFGR